jgi:hypothetical protein
MAEEKTPDVLGQTIVNFARDGTFPEEDEISKSYLEEGALASALKAVETARSELEVSILKLLYGNDSLYMNLNADDVVG